MVEIGLALSSEEHGPNALVEQARRAEDSGFGFAVISDHFHPWIDQQGQSPFVWAVLGGIARETSRMQVGTGVTCPLIRIHPVLVAQAAATAASMFEGRFFLGVGTGERLNEHVLGDRWPPAPERLAMLEEAIGIFRLLWEGGTRSFEGRYYRVEQARIYTLPESPSPIVMAASGRTSAQVAGRLCDGLIATAPARPVVEAFESSSGARKPRYGQLHVCWADTVERAEETALEWWPTAGFPPVTNSELPTPAQFEQIAKTVSPEALRKQMVLGPDPERYLSAITEYARAGFDHVYIHQAGPDVEGFLRFAEREILPHAAGVGVG